MHGNKRRNQPWPRRQCQPGDAGFPHAGSWWRLRGGGMYFCLLSKGCARHQLPALTPTIIPSSTRNSQSKSGPHFFGAESSPSTVRNTEMDSQCLGPALDKRPRRPVRCPSFSRHGSGGCPKCQPKARFVRARQGCELEAHRLEAIERTRRSFCGRHGRVERVKLRWHWPRRRQSNLAHYPPLGRETAELASRSVIALDFSPKAHLACGARARTGARHSAGPGHMQVNNAHFRSLA